MINKFFKKSDRPKRIKSKNEIKKIVDDERGINTIEVVIILAVVVGIALIFRDQMINFANNLLDDVMQTETDVNPSTIRNEKK